MAYRSRVRLQDIDPIDSPFRRFLVRSQIDFKTRFNFYEEVLLNEKADVDFDGNGMFGDNRLCFRATASS